MVSPIFPSTKQQRRIAFFIFVPDKVSTSPGTLLVLRPAQVLNCAAKRMPRDSAWRMIEFCRKLKNVRVMVVSHFWRIALTALSQLAKCIMENVITGF